MKNRLIPKGLWNEVRLFCKYYHIPFEMYGVSKIIDQNFDKNKFIDFCNDLFKDSHITPYEYQIDASAKIIKYRFSQSNIATGAGKTLIAYMVFMYLKNVLGYGKQLIVVPRITLINQLVKEFNEYSGGKHKFTFQKIKAGEDKIKKDVDFIVGTFHSLTKLPGHWFDEIDTLFVDESHGVNAASIKDIIMKNDFNLKLKYGATGTMQDISTLSIRTNNSFIEQNPKLKVSLETQSYLGPLIQTISPKTLIDDGYLPPVKIKMVWMKYKDYSAYGSINSVKSKTAIELLNIEKNIIRSSDVRFRYIIKNILSDDNNSLVLFQDVKNDYGKYFYETLNKNTNKNVFYIDGNVGENKRDYYKTIMESTNTILVASYGTFAVGESVKNIHNIHMVEEYKSKSIIMQTVGRGLRKNEKKTHLTVYDYVDDIENVSTNYVIEHANERRKYYEEYYQPAKGCSFDIIPVHL